MTTAFETNFQTNIPTGVLRRAGTIMMVDDEPAIRTVGRAILSTLNLTVVAVASGEEALETLENAQAQGRLPGLILLDLTMPGGMSGLDTFDQIQDRFPTIPVVACSGFFGDGAEEVCQRLGFADVLPKPYTPDALMTLVRRVLMRLSGEI
jgi:CheY-like chemotaxis protein